MASRAIGTPPSPTQPFPLTRAQKSAQTQQKILDAALMLLRQYGYDQLTVRNICSTAGVSNGTFYHFFDSKDDVMGQYLQLSQLLLTADPDKIGLLEYIIEGYLNLSDSYMSMGLEMTTNFYNPKNQAFNIHTRKPGNYMRDLYYQRLAEAQLRGDIVKDVPIDTIVHDIQSIVIGNTFEWCVMGGTSDLKSNMARMLRTHLCTIFTEQYFERYPKKEG